MLKIIETTLWDVYTDNLKESEESIKYDISIDKIDSREYEVVFTVNDNEYFCTVTYPKNERDKVNFDWATPPDEEFFDNNWEDMEEIINGEISNYSVSKKDVTKSIIEKINSDKGLMNARKKSKDAENLKENMILLKEYFIGVDSSDKNIVWDRVYTQTNEEKEIKEAKKLDFSPDEDNDIFVSDRIRGGYIINYAGKLLKHTDDLDSAKEYILDWMDDNGYYPNVWMVGERGSIDILRLDECSEIPKGLKSWVKDYKAMRKSGNVTDAKKIKANIDKEIKNLKLDSDAVYGKELDESSTFNIGDRVKISDGSGTLSNKKGTVIDRKKVRIGDRGVPKDVSGAYKAVDWSKEVALKMDDGSIETMFKNRLTKIDESVKLVSTYAINNNTDKWAVIVDGYFGLFDSKEKANMVWDMIGGSDDEDGLAETPFGDAELLPPYYPKNKSRSDINGAITYISDYKPIDIENYIKKAQHKYRYIMPKEKEYTPKEKLAMYGGKAQWAFKKDAWSALMSESSKINKNSNRG